MASVQRGGFGLFLYASQKWKLADVVMRILSLFSVDKVRSENEELGVRAMDACVRGRKSYYF
jgi:hypothetical protein